MLAIVETIPQQLETVANLYPADMVAVQLRDIPRISFNINLALGPAFPQRIADVEICDIGGGIGLFSIGCAALGVKRSVLIDDFRDSVNLDVGDGILDLHRNYGVEIYSRDVLMSGINDIPGRFDAITSFDSMEHWHNSPKALFAQVMDKLKPNGIFVLGVPNCVNLRKRVTVPFGHGKWSSIASWYEEKTFRGHVREPDVDDLAYIASDMGLRDVKIWGRNWLGYYAANPLIRMVTHLVDQPLRLMPSLCADIYLTGRKPA